MVDEKNNVIVVSFYDFGHIFEFLKPFVLQKIRNWEKALSKALENPKAYLCDKITVWALNVEYCHGDSCRSKDGVNFYGFRLLL